ncbi:Folylpolyglutamate synthase [Ceraceosorus bombacis]|uniref:Folylpolyglutamate synthase n=1 Tax=Ceraceosorus bombacis TaxID=401625 RepID=A0A0P1BIZ7_9BASI|nr:Folylpolyglutamate synthase [Ceraceosorus bombacis]
MSSTAPTLADALGPAHNIDLTLDRIQQLLGRLGSPQNAIPVIHVAGTNSKGSTTAYLDSLLLNAIGLRTGRFNSPHLIQEQDCCRVCGKVVRDDVWQEAKKRVQAADEGLPMRASHKEEPTSFMEEQPPLRCTSFEKLTAQALSAFALLPEAERPEVLLIEVGLGGRLDATNVFPAQNVLASVICPIDLDHQAFLGNTLRDIAKEKAGIIKSRGLVVVADQRRASVNDSAASSSSSSLQYNTEVPLDSLRHVQAERSQIGVEAAEILDSVREVAFMAGARLVKSYVPWQALQATSFSQSSSSSPWSTSTWVNARYAPILWPSSSTSASYAGTYASRAGDTLISGPSLHLPRTRPALVSILTALQTLWAVARDETPSGLGQDGSDPFEELRLKMAWALRDDRDATDAIRWALNGTKWHGRCEWVDIELPTTVPDVPAELGKADEQTREDGEAMPVDTPPQTGSTSSAVPLHLLVDGAHNPSAAHALRAYIDQCILSRVASLRGDKPTSEIHLAINWILSISEGKDVSGLLGCLFDDGRLRGAEDALSRLLADTHITTSGADFSSASDSAVTFRVKHRIAVTSFSTPVEGMPWVRPLSARDLSSAVHSTLSSSEGAEIESFATVQEAFTWISQEGDGKTFVELNKDESQEMSRCKASFNILAGSLYLVSDLYRAFPHLLADGSS